MRRTLDTVRARVTVKLERSGFSPDQARAVAERVGGEARSARMTTRGVAILAEADTLEEAITVMLERVQAALGAEGVSGALVEWRGEQLVTPRWASRRVMVGNSPYGPIAPGRPMGGGSTGVREPRKPLPGSGSSGASGVALPQPE